MARGHGGGRTTGISVGRRGPRLALTLLGAAALTATAAFLPIADVAHAKQAKPAKNLVVAPKSGQKLKRSPVRVTVRAAWKVRNLRVRLNGQSLTDEFRRAEIGKRNRRTVRVSASHGLRYGMNVLRVTKKRFARKRRSQRVRFTLTRDRPLVGAGRDRRVGVGRSIRLSGHASRGRDAPRARQRRSHPPGSPAGLRMRWRLVRKPAGSEAKLLRDRPAKPSRPRLRRLDEPGRYVVELVVVDRGVRSVADRVVITAVIGPLVPVDTAATVEGERGIAVGYHPAEQDGRGPVGPSERFFPLGDGNALQLVVLTRKELETQPIKAGDDDDPLTLTSWSGPASDASIAELTSLLKNYDDDRLAIVTAWRDPSWAKVNNGFATGALVNTGGKGARLIGAAGASRADELAYGVENGGQLSWIGVPGFPSGQAWEVGGAAQPFGGLDSLRGFLSPDKNENYAYLGTDPTTYDLGPDGQSVSIKIGPTEFSGSLPAGEGGFLVAYLNPTTLEPAPVPSITPDSHGVYGLRKADGSPDFFVMSVLANDLRFAANANHEEHKLLVAIRSIGKAPLARIGNQPPDYQGSFDEQYRDALNSLADAFGAVGATRQLIWGMATNPTGHDSYSLLGSNMLGNEGLPAEGSGTDTGSQLKPDGQSRLSGLLARDKQSRYEPRLAANEPVGGALAALAVAEPTEWPHSDTPGEKAALACIGKAQRLGPDPRVAYWSQTYLAPEWQEIQEGNTGIASMQPSACPDVDAADFKAVRDELVTEIGWLIKVIGYIDALTQPYSPSGSDLVQWADLQDITEEIRQAVKPPANREAGIDAGAIIVDVFDIVGEFHVPGVGALGGVLALLSDLTTSSDGGPTIDWGQQVEAGSAKVGEELAHHLETIAASQEHLVDIIAADYEKLKTVGTLGQCAPDSDDPQNCPPEWQFNQKQQTAASLMYKITAKREIWGGMLPAAYPFVLYATSNLGALGPNAQFVGPQDEISGIRCEIVGEAFPVSRPVFMRYGIFQAYNSGFMVFAVSNTLGLQAPSPSPSLLNPLFASRDKSGDPDQGGLGLDQYRFMTDNWQPPAVAQGGPTRVNWVGLGGRCGPR